MEEPTFVVVSPNVYWNEREKHWDDKDTAFIRTPNARFIPFQSDTLVNLYNVGCHNGKQLYDFTSMETAVTNSASLLHEWFPESVREYPIRSGMTVKQVMTVLLLVIISYILVSIRR